MDAIKPNVATEFDKHLRDPATPDWETGFANVDAIFAVQKPESTTKGH